MSGAKLDPWSDADLAPTVSRYVGNRYYCGHSEEKQFVHSVAKILAMRNARDKAALYAAHSLYILASPPCVGVPMKREPTFSLGTVNVSGKIWFGATAMNSCNGVEIPSDFDANALFTYVSDTLKSGGRPAIYFDGTDGRMTFRFYPKGLDNDADCEDIQFIGREVNEMFIKDCLDGIHRRHFVTPTASIASSTFWADQAKCHPIKEAERAVQGALEIALLPPLGSLWVKREETDASGRYDLSIIEQDPIDPSKKVYHAILELKIVRGYTHTGNRVAGNINKKSVLKGLKQAAAYRAEHRARFSALCCYDMRPNPTLQKHSGRKCNAAIKLDVNFWAWPLFSTPDAARDWLLANPDKTT